MRNCVICGNKEFRELLSIPNFPVFMGATTISDSEMVFENLRYAYCANCFNLQVTELIPLNILYQNNHNVDVVGKIWESHHTEFANFIKKNQPAVVLEIGSPNANIFKILQNETWLKKWYSIEPNPSTITGINEKFDMINAWVEKGFSYKKYINEIPNAVVMSHVFEHFHNPTEILDILHSQLKEGDSIFISIPNMKYISQNQLMPPSGLHFEHTFYVELKNARYLFEKSGFEVTDIQEFSNHSYFIKATKTSRHTITRISSIHLENLSNIQNFKKTKNYYINAVKSINEKIKDFKGEIYVYGSHFSAQFLLYLGVDKSKINGCLDQSPSKIGKTLYGTNLKVFSPTLLKGKDNVSVICYMGPYTDEIKNTILNINSQVKFI